MTDEKKPVKRKSNGKNSPVIGDNGLNVEPGDNAKYLKVSMQLMKLPDIDLKDTEQVNKRLEEYFAIHFENDLKPTVAGMGLALNGMDRRRLWEIKTGALKGGHTEYDLPTSTVDAIKKAYKLMENLWENYMQNGKINPVSGIFLGKNNFGYQDKTEYVVTPNTNSDADYSTDDIRKRYAIDSPEQLSINSSNSSDSGNFEE
jgi:hypothetical protein